MSESRAQRKSLNYLTEFFEVYYSDQREREGKRREIWQRLSEESKEPSLKQNDLECSDTFQS